MQTVKNEAGTSLPQAFTFNASNQQVRTVIIDGEPYFVAKDVCLILGISNHKDAASRLDDDEKARSVLPTQFGDKETNLVNESGLYHLIFQSRKPEAKAFRKWVTSEVLPQLRKTGKYEVKPPLLKYPRRGEGMNADMMDLLYLIQESLLPGDQKAIALELGVSRQTVYYVLNGKQKSSKVLKACYDRARQNRAANALYVDPGRAADNLRGGLDAPVIYENTLPPVQVAKSRGKVIGLQNARKRR